MSDTVNQLALFGCIAPCFLLGLLSYWDTRTRKLPNRFVGALALMALAYLAFGCITGFSLFPPLMIFTSPVDSILRSLVGGVLGVGIPLCADAIFKRRTGESGFGMGDCKLLGALGLLFGPNIVLVLGLACIFGVLTRLSRPTTERTFAFGPYIALATVALAFVL